LVEGKIDMQITRTMTQMQSRKKSMLSLTLV